MHFVSKLYRLVPVNFNLFVFCLSSNIVTDYPYEDISGDTYEAIPDREVNDGYEVPRNSIRQVYNNRTDKAHRNTNI